MEDKDDLAVVEGGGSCRDISRVLISVRPLPGWLMVLEARWRARLQPYRKLPMVQCVLQLRWSMTPWRLLLMRPMVQQVLLRILVTPSTIGHTSNSSIGTGL